MDKLDILVYTAIFLLVFIGYTMILGIVGLYKRVGALEAKADPPHDQEAG